MKKLKLIYNPFSGDTTFKNYLDLCVDIFQKGGYETHLFRCGECEDIQTHLSQTDPHFYDAIVASGGDGTVNLVLNAMIKNGIQAPLGILPSGTANDFANFLNITPHDVKAAAQVIVNGKTVATDVGVANDRYFINVCGAGLLANISQQVDTDIKNLLGKLAYYIKGIEQLPNFTPMPIRITTTEQTIEEKVYFFLILNSAGAGSFDKLAPNASISDGEFDFVAFRNVPILDLPRIFVKVLKGDSLNDDGILYIRDHYFKIECLSENKAFFETDVDGEVGPSLPIKVKTIPRAIEIFTNK